VSARRLHCWILVPVLTLAIASPAAAASPQLDPTCPPGVTAPTGVIRLAPTDLREAVSASLAEVGADGTATFILGGEIEGDAPDILMVYPEGNYIRASDDRPFLQIGESKYGKFTLELAVASQVGLTAATKIALTSMVSTSGANLSVGPPYDLVIYRNGSFEPFEARINADSPFLSRLEAVWAKHLHEAIADLPTIEEGDLET